MADLELVLPFARPFCLYVLYIMNRFVSSQLLY